MVIPDAMTTTPDESSIIIISVKGNVADDRGGGLPSLKLRRLSDYNLHEFNSRRSEKLSNSLLLTERLHWQRFLPTADSLYPGNISIINPRSLLHLHWCFLPCTSPSH